MSEKPLKQMVLGRGSDEKRVSRQVVSIPIH